MNKLIHLFVTLLLWAGVLSVDGQSPVFRHFELKDGLPSNNIYHVLQDSEGFIWFGTDNGVSRYDGSSFVNFGLEDGLMTNSVYECYEDQFQRIWFVGQSKKLCYYQNGVIHPYRYNEQIDQHVKRFEFPFKRSFHVLSDSSVMWSFMGTNPIVVSATGSIETIHGKKMKNFVYELENKALYGLDMKNDELNSFAFMRGDSCWIHRLPQPKKAYRSSGFRMLNTGAFTSINFTQTLIAFDGDSILASTELETPINWHWPRDTNSVWVGTTNNGIQEYAMVDGRFELRSSYLESESVSSNAFDQDGGLWVTTLYNGVYYNANRSLKKYVISSESNVLKGVHLDGNGLHWFDQSGGYGRVYRGNEVESYQLASDGYIQQVGAGEEGKLVVLTRTGSLKLNAELKDGKACFDDDSWGINLNGKSVVRHQDTLYYATGAGFVVESNAKERVYNGIKMMKSDTGEVRKELFEQSWAHAKRLVDLIFVPERGFLVAGSKQLFEVTSDSVDFLRPVGEELSSVITDMCYDPGKNRVLIGTRSAGLFSWNGDTLISVYPELEGEWVREIHVGQKYIWLAQELGIVGIPRDVDTSLVYVDRNHGLNGAVNALLEKGDVLYIGAAGLYELNWRTFKSQTKGPPVSLDRVLLFDDHEVQEGEFTYDQNFFTFKFSNLTFAHEPLQQFRYRLVGVDDKWINSESPIVRYSQLDPGDYQFEVEAKNRDGYWSVVPATFAFCIQPPIWQRLWFIIFGVMLVFGAATLIVKSRIERIRREDRLASDLNLSRQQSLSQQMNPHFIYNSLNSIQNFILKNDKLSSNLYLGKFANLMRANLEHSQGMELSLQDELECLNSYLELERLRFEDKFDFEIIVDPEIDQEEVMIPTLLLQPYAENSILHAFNMMNEMGCLTLRIKEVGSYLHCEIEDNGIGYKRSRELKEKSVSKHKSFGSTITANRLKLVNEFYGSDMSVEYFDKSDNGGQGTIVKVCIPILNDQ